MDGVQLSQGYRATRRQFAFLNLGAKIRCSKNRYTDLKSALDQPLPCWSSWRYISHWQPKHSVQIFSFHGVIFVWILQLATHHNFKHKAQFACKYQIPHGIILCFLSNFRVALKMKFYLVKLVMLFGKSLRKYFNGVLTDKPQNKNIKFQGYLGSLTIKIILSNKYCF